MIVIFRNGDTIENVVRLVFERIGLGPQVRIVLRGKNENGIYEIPFKPEDVLEIKQS